MNTVGESYIYVFYLTDIHSILPQEAQFGFQGPFSFYPTHNSERNIETKGIWPTPPNNLCFEPWFSALESSTTMAPYHQEL